MQSLGHSFLLGKVRRHSAIPIIIALFFGYSASASRPSLLENATSTCNTSSPSSGAYSVTLCFSAPASGATLTGNVTVTATVSVSGTSPGVQKVIFYLNSGYLLTDFQSSYSFVLPTAKWVDGSYTISVKAYMRDGFITQSTSMPVIFSNGVTSPPVNNNQFQPTSGMAPSNGAPFIVAAIGDGASGQTNSGKVSSMIQSLSPNLFIYLGDVYDNGSTPEFYNWYGTSSTYFGRLRSITDPTIGNHEYLYQTGHAYFDYWDNVPSYYSFNANGWHIISLNSNGKYVPTSSGSVQYNWLQSDLSASASQACTIVFYHHPLYNIGPEEPATGMAAIWSLLAQYSADIVLNGHDHDYQRWVPLDGNGNPNANGVTEFVAGAGGHTVQKFITSDSRVAYSNDTSPTVIGALFLQLNPQGANFYYRNISGKILDSGVIPCKPAINDTTAPTTPGNLTATASSSTSVQLSWTASSDNVGVAGYTIYRNGSAIKTVPFWQLTYSATTVTSGTTYSYSVDAFDSAGNHSAQTPPVSVTPGASSATPTATAAATKTSTPTATPSSLATATPAMTATATATVSAGQSVAFTPNADAYVNSSYPDTNYGTLTTLRADGSPDVHSYVRFNVQGLGGYSIKRVRLLFYMNSGSSAGLAAEAVADNSWGETTITYNNAPALGATLATSGAVTSGAWSAMDVTSYVAAEGTYSLGVTTPGSTAISFASRESGANAPQLIVDLN